MIELWSFYRILSCKCSQANHIINMKAWFICKCMRGLIHTENQGHDLALK